MNAITTQVLKSRRWSTLWWSLGASLYILLVNSVYQNFLTSQKNNLGQTLQQLPDTLRSFVSIKSDFMTPAGFLSSEPYYVLLPIIFIILAIGLGGSLLASEERNATLELLLARPVSRGRVLLQKALGGFITLLTVVVVTGIVMTVTTRLFTMDISVAYLWEAQFMLLLLATLFGALAFTLTALGSSARKTSFGITALLALGGYVLTSLEQQVSWLRWPAKLLPYHYYNPSDTLTGSFDWNVAIGYLLVIVVLGFIAYSGFRSRDIE